MIDNLAVFVFEEGQNTACSFCGTLIVPGFSIAVIGGISVINLDYRNLNSVVPLPLPVFYTWIVGLFECYSWEFEGRLTLSLMIVRIRALWFGIQRSNQLGPVRKSSTRYMHVKSTNDAL